MRVRTALVAAVAVISVACQTTPTSILLQIRSEPASLKLDELRLTIYDAAGIAAGNRRLPEQGAPQLPSSVVLYPRAGGSLRLHGRGLLAASLVGEGTVRVESRVGEQVTATLVVKAGALGDRDDDGVPDEIDNCPDVDNPAQGPCPGADARPDGPGLDGPPSDGHVDRRPFDRPQLDTPRVDGSPLDVTPPLDKPKPDSRPPDRSVATPDKPKADSKLPDKLVPLDKPKPDSKPPDTLVPTGWQYRVPVTVNATAATGNLANYQVVVELGNSFMFSHAKSDGSDVRFSSSSTPGTFNLPYWIETWSPPQAKIWVRIPSIPGGQNSTIYMFYGNSAATAASSQSATFPGKFVSSGDLTLGGAQSYDWFELQAGHTLTITTGQALQITARKINIQGSVLGDGAGHAGGAADAAGTGPGAGGAGTSSGAGGGGYGGAGGKGGYDTGETPGAGGASYGMPSDALIAMGSGGGGGAVPGGNGGGAITLAARDVTVSGNISVNGKPGTGANQSGGGGAGGGVLVRGHDVTISGACSAKGGDGGSGSSSANDGGGGGGGGRIKFLHEKAPSLTGTTSVAGGAGGKYGSTYGEAGAAGSTYSGVSSCEVTTTSLGAEVKL